MVATYLTMTVSANAMGMPKRTAPSCTNAVKFCRDC